MCMQPVSNVLPKVSQLFADMIAERRAEEGVGSGVEQMLQRVASRDDATAAAAAAAVDLAHVLPSLVKVASLTTLT